MRRSPSLISLSHDHHHGLVACRRIEEHIQAGTEPARMEAYVKDYWIKDLKRHFEEEENSCFRKLPQSDPYLQQAIEDHKALKGLAEGALDEASLLCFADLLRRHIRFEERVLFPRIEQMEATEKTDLIT